MMEETSFNELLRHVVTEQNSHLCVGLDVDLEKVRASIWPQVQEAAREAVDAADEIADALQSYLAYAKDAAEQARQGDDELAVDEDEDEEDVEDEEGEEEDDDGIPPGVAAEAALMLFTKACADAAAAFKVNAAFFEPEHYPSDALHQQLEESECDALTIFDGKRGDIGNSSLYYADAIFEEAFFDATTINPLMGFDAVEPFISDPQHGAFLLCLTSNPGAEDFLLHNDLYLRIAEKAVKWNKNNNIGLVVGATRPEYAARVRDVAPNLSLLVPGIGAQGGLLTEILDAIKAKQNPLFLVNASRSILYAKPRKDEKALEAVTRAAEELRLEIQNLIR